MIPETSSVVKGLPGGLYPITSLVVFRVFFLFLFLFSFKCFLDYIYFLYVFQEKYQKGLLDSYKEKARDPSLVLQQIKGVS